MFSIGEQRYLDYEDFKAIIKDLELKSVPIIKDDFRLYKTVDEMVRYSTQKSLFNPEVYLEGIVVRPLQECKDEDLGRLSFKIINPEYLLKHE